MSDIAVSVEHVTKEFVLQNERRDSLKERLVKGRSKGGKTFRALDDVSFQIPKGSTFGLIGHNGSGKSTMLKLLAGVYRPTSGSVMVNGKVSALLELGAGFHGDLTGRENIFLNGAILGLTHKEIEHSIDEIIEFADIGQFIDEPVKVYSSGMYVRLGFAVAVTLDPQILIVDEIIAVGDEEFQRKCFDHLYQLRKKGCTIAFVTHSLGLAQDLCDEAIWLDHGKTQKLGKTREVIDSYLNAVNSAEAEKASAQKQDVLAPVPRQGSGEVRMSKVEIIDEAGKSVPFAVFGKPLTLRIWAHAVEPVSDVEVGLAFVHQDGMTLAGPNSGMQKVKYSFPIGDSFVDFHWSSLMIQPGTYGVSTSFIDSGHPYDYSDREFDITIRSESAIPDPGLVRLNGQWSREINDSLAGKDAES
ncbi:ABC transporter ATP-binding protein [Mobiluncus curtisii]|uniref:ABC transporter, ATP-binding protein n=2 Tax=Mobiluncus curtisii TaxID=2051 RepID=D6ZKY3_MOBCV|nr:ABC transporter ATP-binding protein [Mobiluncus curtisii]ADI67382.1 ABC transporter, ATP-binding protein [Mobiluncus curtisii ATCC 43063]EFL93777.1 ABC transporter, ATP-binding protein [Mobiluncus curtisii subsp. curtisii ATCC 35241]MCU9986329.1 ABC transporter ATP-binding protein [Mobiluncus curtisii]MCV0000056.1 ABC transporter ATP-binding protein [Mobiluncus curtisii]MCV0021043.1 ABC transporter ATP-binding protein [Mobiluncus curtisii]